MDGARALGGQVGELMDDEALAGAGEPGDKDHPLLSRQALQLIVEGRIGPRDDPFTRIAWIHRGPL